MALSSPLAPEMSGLHISRMQPGNDAMDASRRLASEAEPLRHALALYFQRRVAVDEVEDLVQEVFARIVSRDSTEPVHHLPGYVFQTAASVLADRGRRRAVRRADAHIAFDCDRHAAADFDPARILSGKEELRAVTAALLSLPERTRNIFVLHRLEGLKHREVAARFGISVSAVEKHMAWAIQHLNSRMKGLR